ncbi:MAG: nucleotidyltransferase domain-containing protein [Nitrospira sp.]|nr:nucleotidyltransferase domain-containing protein [Nitrospira sp.]MDH4371569.1 nucleotidyltransferase domain-containing protein [Nitrospira sp.]MDH5348753.1 nucleotidyltransferase domain-containing protein [Nitrospira sp.]MDH5498842.1 nucleotidyltransferase domain-containing protein [Nitrospira sp.]MDH5724209.1 nucleotidyltransferase domain-containing protein [Nitrospira sp.]
MILKSMQLQKPPHTSDLDRNIEHVMARHPSVVLAILFGSMAKDRARNDSDLDIAVATSTPLTAQTHLAIIEDLVLAVGRPVDLIDLDRTHNPLLQQILTKGRRVLCHDRTRYAELLLRMVYEEADLMPYYRRILSERRQAWIGT